VLPAAVAIRMSDLPCLLAIVRAVLRPKHVAMPDDSDEAAQRLALLLVEAFVTSLTDAQAADGDHQTQALTSPSASDQLLPSPAERRAAAVLPGEREPTREVGVRSSERPPASRPFPPCRGRTHFPDTPTGGRGRALYWFVFTEARR